MLLVTGVLLLALDVGRSLYARFAFASPTQVWDPPGRYARISWPPGADVQAGASLGVRVFAQH